MLLDAHLGVVLCWYDFYTDCAIANRSGISLGDQTAVDTSTPQCIISGGTEHIVTNGLITEGGSISAAYITSTGAISSGTNNINKLSSNCCNIRKTGYSS